MKHSVNPFTQNLAQKNKQVGLWVSLCSNFAAETIAYTGYDWVVVDMEHSHNSLESVLGQLQAFETSNTTALVRPEWNDPVLVKRLLDLGANGLLFPMVQTVEEAEQAVAATRYPPRGIRGVSGMTRANKFGRVADYFKRVEDETTVLIQLETQQALENAVEIASVDGVHGAFFGPADIAADMGLLGQITNPDVWDAIWVAARKLIDKGIPVGTLVMDPEFAAKLLNDGFTFVACGTDTTLLTKASDARLAAVKENLT